MKMKNLIIVDDRRDVRNSLIALAYVNGHPKEKMYVASSINEFFGLAQKSGNAFVQNSNIILDVNLPDGKSSKIIKDFNLKDNFAIFSAMGEKDFTEFKSILEGNRAYQGRVFPKDNPYGVFETLGLLANGKDALEKVVSVKVEVGVVPDLRPFFAIENLFPIEKFDGLFKNVGKEKITVNYFLQSNVSDKTVSMEINSYNKFFDTKMTFVKMEDFLNADLNLVCCSPKERTNFLQAYQLVARTARHVEEGKSRNIGEVAQSYLSFL